MATSTYSVQGKNVLLNGKVVSTAADETQAITMAQRSAQKTGGTYVSGTPTSTTAPTTTVKPPTTTTTRTPSQQAAIDRQLAIEKAAGIVPTGTSTTPAPTPTPAPVVSSTLNTVGLAEADMRRRNGTATATDLKNLEYAESKGWSAGGATSSTTTPTATGSEIPGLNTNGLAEANVRRTQGNATPEDLKNLAYAESKGWKPGSTGFSNVTTPEQANAAINDEQDSDIASKTESDEPPVRKTVEELMKGITEIVTPEGGEPAAPNFTQQMEAYRAEYGLSALETQLDGLRAEEQDILARRNERIIAERGKTVAMNVIGGRISETERQENERLDIVQRAITNATNQMNTKLNIVNTLMGTRELDYTTAVQRYDKEMATNISMYNAAKNIDDEFKTDQQHEQAVANSNAQIMMNALSASGRTVADLTPDEQLNLTKLSIQAGLGPNFFSLVAERSAGKEILTSISSDDDSRISVIYKDGTSAVFQTGIKNRVPSSGGPTQTEKTAAQKEIDRNAIVGDVNGSTGADGYANRDQMKAIRRSVAINNPENLSWFDDAWPPATILNPADDGNSTLISNNKW